MLPRSGKKNRLLILLTNDDGYQAQGLLHLRRGLKTMGRIVVVAPDRDRSGVSHSLTVTRPLRVRKVEQDFYCVDGTPTDAVMIAVNRLLKRPPDLLLSGINMGANMGEDVTYSGTVAAAIEGTLLGIPSIAISLVGNGRRQFAVAARFARRIAKAVLKYGLPEGIFLNVNVPGSATAKVDRYTFTRLGKRVYEDVITEKIDPRGNNYYWIAGRVRVTGKGPRTDYRAIERGYISITPLAVDTTAVDFLAELGKWRL